MIQTVQLLELVQYNQGLSLMKSKYSMYIDSILSCLHNQLKSQANSSTDTLSHVLKILATHGWEKTSFGYESIQFLASIFAQKAGVNSVLLQEEWDDVVYYASILSKTHMEWYGGNCLILLC